jgi:DNA-binding GntR family transcriptional regulator
MLREEGLVEIEPNQRTRIAGLDPQELDDIYASRILMETLALSMTIGSFTAANRREAKRLLTAMRRSAKSGDFDGWFTAHADYHRLITAATGEALQRQLSALADRTIRYIRIYQLLERRPYRTRSPWCTAASRRSDRQTLRRSYPIATGVALRL